MVKYGMSNIEFPPSKIGQDFACGLSKEPINHLEIFGLIKSAVCESCPSYNKQCIPALPERIVIERVIAIQNGVGYGSADLPLSCTLIQGGTLYMHNGHWIQINKKC